MTFEEKLNHWRQLIEVGDNEGQKDFYRNEMFDDVIQKVVNRSENLSKKYKYLISLVGFSPEPIILTIKALQPEKIYFIITENTEEQLNFIVEKCGLKTAQFRREVVDSSKTSEVYAAIKKITSQKDISQFAIDITGGKKSMVGGAAEAGGFLGCAVFYVDFEDYNPDLRKPIPGSEFLNFLENPYEVFGDIEVDRALSLYEKGNFSGALETIGRLLNRVPDPTGIEIKKELIHFFQNWEDYQFGKALSTGSELIKRIKRYRKFEHLIEPLSAKIEILREIVEKNAEKWIVLNHLFMSRRYFNRGKYDFAILLQYRTLEMALAYRLKTRYNIDPAKPEYSDSDKLYQKYKNIIISAFGPEARIPQSLPLKIGLIDSFILLESLEDTIIAKSKLKNIIEAADHRNQGILAHGTKASTSAQFKKMQEYFTPVIVAFVNEYFDEASPEKYYSLFDLINGSLLKS